MLTELDELIGNSLVHGEAWPLVTRAAPSIIYLSWGIVVSPKTRHAHGHGLMLGQRRRRWTNLKPSPRRNIDFPG